MKGLLCSLILLYTRFKAIFKVIFLMNHFLFLVKILFNSPFTGVVHSRDYRTPDCMSYGNGSNILTMSLNLLAKQGTPEHCGILVSNGGPEVSRKFYYCESYVTHYSILFYSLENGRTFSSNCCTYT
jgi:hypothetical protein